MVDVDRPPQQNGGSRFSIDRGGIAYLIGLRTSWATFIVSSATADLSGVAIAIYAGAMEVAVPFAGVVSPLVAEGDRVESGQAVARIEAMKMEASITAPIAGVVKRLVIADTCQAAGGDLLLVLE